MTTLITDRLVRDAKSAIIICEEAINKLNKKEKCMTDKLPVVGKKYRLQKRYLDNNNNKTTRENKKVIVTEIEERKGDYLIHYKDDDGITNGLSSISFLGLYYEEDSKDNLQQKYENLKQAAQNLVDALEAEKIVMSKPEPKIDMKEERVEPVSIWKDVSDNLFVLVKLPAKLIN